MRSTLSLARRCHAAIICPATGAQSLVGTALTSRPFSTRAAAPSGEPCPRCATGCLRHRASRHGPFLGCSSYPQCRFTRDLGSGLQEQPPRGIADPYSGPGTA
ncbi:topoisomerase DNA-binding C4 zinc finger domain-containing protein [Azohydromonas aeria]|uniref:topoisomerase DNA-binding C4 zinc finger domain-containing protein n=1 Tax=Azohydromonas aeria TaxID=2590212 RepID=UPI0018DF59C2